MSYAQQGIGSYYELSGFGALRGFGAIDFNADAVWADWLAGSSGNNAAGKRAADTVRAALAQLGYGPVSMGAMWGSAQDKAAYGRFASENGVTPTSGMPGWWANKAGIIKLGELVKAGGNPGGGTIEEYHSSGGELIPGAGPGQSSLKAGMSTGMMIGIGALVVAGVGAMAFFAKKKKPGATAH